MYVIVSKLVNKNLLAIDVDKLQVVEISSSKYYSENRKSNIWGVENNKLVSYYSLPLVDLNKKKIKQSNFDIYTLVAKKSTIGERKRYLVSNPFGELKFFSYAEVIELIIRSGFTNLLRTERCIKSKKNEIIVLPKDKKDMDKEKSLFVLDPNERNDVVFRAFIDNQNTSAKKYLGEYIKAKRPLNEVAVFADVDKLYGKVASFQKKSFMDEKFCNFCFFTIERAKSKGKYVYIDIIKNNIGNKEFFSYPCLVCEDMQLLASFASFEGNGYGAVNPSAPYDLLFNKGVVGEDLACLQIIYHEYCHYLSSNNGNSGFVENLKNIPDEKYRGIFNFIAEVVPYNVVKDVLYYFFLCLTEGMTEILSGYLLYEDVKEMWYKDFKFINEDGKTVISLKEIEDTYSPLLKDLKTLKDIDFMFDYKQRSKNYKHIDTSPYLNNMLAVLLFMEKLGVDFMVYAYMSNRFDLLFQNILLNYGKDFVLSIIRNFYEKVYLNMIRSGVKINVVLSNSFINSFKSVKNERNLNFIFINNWDNGVIEGEYVEY